MKLTFDPVPFLDQVPRPVAQIRVAGAPYVVPALIDSGAVGNRFSEAIAVDAGLDVSLGSTTHVTIGGQQHFGHVLEVQLVLGLYEWVAPVAFLEGWTHPYHVLGLVGFFDRFDVRIKGSSRQVHILRH